MCADCSIKSGLKVVWKKITSILVAKKGISLVNLLGNDGNILRYKDFIDR